MQVPVWGLLLFPTEKCISPRVLYIIFIGTNRGETGETIDRNNRRDFGKSHETGDESCDQRRCMNFHFPSPMFVPLCHCSCLILCRLVLARIVALYRPQFSENRQITHEGAWETHLDLYTLRNSKSPLADFHRWMFRSVPAYGPRHRRLIGTNEELFGTKPVRCKLQGPSFVSVCWILWISLEPDL